MKKIYILIAIMLSALAMVNFTVAILYQHFLAVRENSPDIFELKTIGFLMLISSILLSNKASRLP